MSTRISSASYLWCRFSVAIYFQKGILCAELPKKIPEPGISKIWIVACLATNAFSLILCDSNASLVLALGYAIVYIVYMFFADKAGLSPSKIILKITALFLVGVFLTGSALMFRTICQEGFSVVVSKTTSVVDLLLGKTESELVQEELTPEQREQLEKDKITFSHENKNIDSGRKKLWLESINLLNCRRLSEFPTEILFSTVPNIQTVLWNIRITKVICITVFLQFLFQRV